MADLETLSKCMRDKITLDMWKWLQTSEVQKYIRRRISTARRPWYDLEDIIQHTSVTFLEHWEETNGKVLSGYGGYDRENPEKFFGSFLNMLLVNWNAKVHRRTELETINEDAIAEQFGINYIRYAVEDPLELLLTRYQFEERWRTLPKQLREVFALSFFEQRSGQEVAETLGISENHVNVARHKIKKHMSGEQYV